MSRSFKQPYVSDYGRKKTKRAKRRASKAVRDYNETVVKGKWYKKLFCSWNIFDYISYYPEKETSFRK